MGTDALAGKGFVDKSWDNVHMRVRHFQPSGGSAVPADVVAVGLILLIEHFFCLFEKYLSFFPYCFCQVERCLTVSPWEDSSAANEHGIGGVHEKQRSPLIRISSWILLSGVMSQKGQAIRSSWKSLSIDSMTNTA